MPAFLIKHRSAKSWHKISIQVDSRMTDAVAAYLTDLTGTGLEISIPANGQTTTGYTFPTDKITAYIPIGPKKSDKKTAAKNIHELSLFLSKVWHIFPDCPAPQLLTEIIMEEDWGGKWKSFFTSFQITPTLTIKPSWENAKELKGGGEANKAVIEMDPGLAFGTGHHASTQLALLLIEGIFLKSPKSLKKVLDVGTGSGILAMACGLFGAKEVLAVDNDPDAVETAKQNILRNHLEGNVTVSGQDILSVKTADFDLVVANIIHDILAALAKPLTDIINPKGFLVLSGILRGEQEHSIREMYAKQGLVFIKSLVKDEWTALQFQKK
jgi:ribosomal protein L11 methyltransferase